MRKTEQPFTKEEFETFKSYCYTAFGLHFVGDTMKKYTFIDGDAVVQQVRQAAATIEKLKADMGELIGELDDALSFMETLDPEEEEEEDRRSRKEALIARIEKEWFR